MKKIVRLDAVPTGLFDAFDQENASSKKSVQGGFLQRSNGIDRIESGGRFKCFRDGNAYVKIERGIGHFKWARGEMPFAAGETFYMQSVGEFEVNGNCCFMISENRNS